MALPADTNAKLTALFDGKCFAVTVNDLGLLGMDENFGSSLQVIQKHGLHFELSLGRSICPPHCLLDEWNDQMAKWAASKSERRGMKAKQGHVAAGVLRALNSCILPSPHTTPPPIHAGATCKER